MPTVKDIAKRSGVSTATVSYVLNNGPRAVLPSTRARVLEAIRELEYHPNAHARSLKGKSANTIGVVLPHRIAQPFENAYFGPVIAGIMDVTTQLRMATMLFTGYNWEEAELEAPKLCDGRSDGLIIIAPPKRGRLIKDVLDRGRPLVVIGTHPEEVEIDTVDSDNVKGGYVAARRLLDLGHRKIAVVEGSSWSTSSGERVCGYRQAMAEFSCPVDDAWLLSESFAEGQEHLLWEMLANPRTRPTAIFCVHDFKAMLVLKVAHQIGLRIPHDLSVIGFDDVHDAATSTPPLTTVRQHMRQIGIRAVELLAARIENSALEAQTVLFDVHLIERSTTGPP